jgi:hypothetical protein
MLTAWLGLFFIYIAGAGEGRNGVKRGLLQVKDVLEALDIITGGRCLRNIADVSSGRNRFVVTKSSDIPGKSCTELPGLVFGDPEGPVKKIAVAMTLTESAIELAGATGINAIVAHHPVADAANSGGVTLRNYLSLYNLAVFELHEAFHGLHPGIAFIHGHRVFRTDIAYGGVPGNILMVGRALEGDLTLGKILDRVRMYANFAEEQSMLQAEQRCRGCPDITDAITATGGEIMLGTQDTPVHTVIHIFPHTGFTAKHLEAARKGHPDADTVIASISRVRNSSELVTKAKKLGLNFVLGNSHALEILENGMPLAVALKKLLPAADVVLLRERITSTPVEMVATPAVRAYAHAMADQFLLPNDKGVCLQSHTTKE